MKLLDYYESNWRIIQSIFFSRLYPLDRQNQSNFFLIYELTCFSSSGVKQLIKSKKFSDHDSAQLSHSKRKSILGLSFSVILINLDALFLYSWSNSRNPITFYIYKYSYDLFHYIYLLK